MRSPSTSELHGYAKWLTSACEEAGLSAEQYGTRVRILGSCNHLTEDIDLYADENDVLRWWWSWGKPITALGDDGRVLTADEVDELVTVIAHVVAIPIKPKR